MQQTETNEPKDFVHYNETKKDLINTTEFEYAGKIKGQSDQANSLQIRGKRKLPQGIMIIDGATGSELDRRGVDCVLPYWSAGAMIHSPHEVKEIHKLYLKAGAQAVTTNTFNTTYRLLERAGVGNSAEQLCRKACQLAIEARDEINPQALVFGCVSPIGQCYDVKECPDYQTCINEHRTNMQYMVDEGVDFLLIETSPTATSSLAGAEVAEELMPGRWGISFSLPLETVGILRCGTPLEDLIPKLTKAAFIGINCMDGKAVTKQVKRLKEIAPKGMRISAYGNIGYWVPPEDYQVGIKEDNSVQNDAMYAAFVKEWLEAGADIVGGCCGTSPDTIRMLHATAQIHRHFS